MNNEKDFKAAAPAQNGEGGEKNTEKHGYRKHHGHRPNNTNRPHPEQKNGNTEYAGGKNFVNIPDSNSNKEKNQPNQTAKANKAAENAQKPVQNTEDKAKTKEPSAGEAKQKPKKEANNGRQNQRKNQSFQQRQPKSDTQNNAADSSSDEVAYNEKLSDISGIFESKSNNPFDFGDYSVKAEDDSYLDKMPPDPTLDALFGYVKSEPQVPAEGTEVVGVHFPQGGKVYWFGPSGIEFAPGDPVIVETARGTELGEIALGNHKIPESEIVAPLRNVIRKATKEDLKHEEDNNAKCDSAFKICAEKVAKHNLDMKLVGAQYTFDNAKLIFYFTAAARVDFRELVKDLASEFHTRIELRQIGIRDEAKMLGGRGVCGRKLCCSSFLPNFAQVSVRMAKEQGLSLNSSKISGNCGRLMCCLRFEQSTYEAELSLMPPPESIVDTPDGRGVVTEVKPVGYTVKVKLNDKQDQMPKGYHLNDIKVIKKAAYHSENDNDSPAMNADVLPDN